MMVDAIPSIRVLVADDHEVVREGASVMINGTDGMEVCATAGNGRELLELAAVHRPDVIVTDLHMPQSDVLSVTREIKKKMPDIEFVIFTADPGERIVVELFEAGVKSFIRKGDASDSLVAAIRAAAQHKRFFTPFVSGLLFSRVAENSAHGPAAANDAPTAREREILRLICDGKSNKEIADALSISTRTAETHRATLMRKAHASSPAELVRYAIRNSIIEP